MAVNLVLKYASDIEKRFIFESLVFGKGTAKYDWTGTKKVRSITPVTVALNNYDIGDSDSTAARFGALTEVQDTLNTYDIERDRSFNLAIDKGNNESQMLVKKAGVVMRMEVDEQLIPEMDTWALSKYASTSNVQVSTVLALTKSNIIGAYASAVAALVNQKVPATGLISWISATEFSKLVTAPEFLNLEKLGSNAVGKGVVGECQGVQIIRVPDSYMPAKTSFIVAHPSALMPVKKIETLRILEEHPDIDGAALQGRVMYDAFVLAQKVKGVYVHKNAA
ncbi:MAG: hypothetical protein IJK53_08210 [Erysipelotrichaceae bacterium]|nr:hypothetical protein [Erysipelotrichaceae bacterium]